MNTTTFHLLVSKKGEYVAEGKQGVYSSDLRRPKVPSRRDFHNSKGELEPPGQEQ
jgi:hypothetical protein